MSYTRFIHLMHRSLVTHRRFDKKHIIRFINSYEFNRCLSQIKAFRPRLSKLAWIQPIHTLNAICCSLRSTQHLRKHKGILFIEEDCKLKCHITISSELPSVPWGVREIKSPQAWRISAGKKVKIGVIDTGADFNHPNLRHALAGGVNFVQRNYNAQDDNGHGSHIAGTIAAGMMISQSMLRGPKLPTAKGNEAVSIIGVAPLASLYAIKAFDKNGSAFVSDIILGIDWCVRNKLDMINMSFGMKNRSLSLRDAIRIAHDAGIIIVASSGNDGKVGEIDYPARFVHTIAVGATDKNKRIAHFSNRSKSINIYAPGDKIFSTWNHGGYNTISGTSMATSHVTGVIALCLAINPNLTPKRIKAMLRRTATPLKTKSGIAGEVNALRAIYASARAK